MKLEQGGLTWNVRDEGSGPPVVWIHGYPLSARIWDAQMAIPGVRHIVPDLPGFGESAPPPGAMTIPGYADGVLAVLDAAGVRAAVVAGLSMGGYIALSLAGKAPDRVAGLLLVDTRETPDTPEARQKRFEAIEQVRREGVRPIADAMLPKMLTAHTIETSPGTAAAVRAIMESASPAGVEAALRAMAERDDATPLLPRLTVPVLIACGSEDTVTPPSDAARMKNAIPEADLVLIEGAAHLSNVERPAEFNEAATAFLRRIGAWR